MTKKQDGFKSIRLREKLVDEIDEFVQTEKAKQAGYHSRSDFVDKAIREELRDYLPRFEHLNMMEDNVKIVDFNNNRIATLYFRNPGGVHCDLCDTDDCEHIEFALDQEDVQRELKKHGWKRQKPSIHDERAYLRILKAINNSRNRPVTLSQIVSKINQIKTREELDPLIENGFIRIKKTQDSETYHITEKGRNASSNHAKLIQISDFKKT